MTSEITNQRKKTIRFEVLECLFVFLLFLASGLFEWALGKTGITVVTRLLGMLLAALSVQFMLDGLSAFGFGPGAG